jgi:hypothetical protein
MATTTKSQSKARRSAQSQKPVASVSQPEPQAAAPNIHNVAQYVTLLSMLADPKLAQLAQWIEAHEAQRFWSQLFQQEYMLARAQLGPGGNIKLAMDGAEKVADEGLARWLKKLSPSNAAETTDQPAAATVDNVAT